MRQPIKAIKERTSLKIEVYCESRLDTTYKSFSYRVRKGALKELEYAQIILDTGLSFEQIWGVNQKGIKTSLFAHLPVKKEGKKKTGIAIIIKEDGDKVMVKGLEEDDFIDTFEAFRK